MRYLDIAETLRGRLASGEYGAGGALESEADLGRDLGASRVTIRRALELLRSEGLVSSRRGSGWFVALDPVRQPLGRVTTVEAALAAAGAVPERRVLEFGFEPATTEVSESLGLPPRAEVLRVRRLSLADGEPFAIVTVWVPAELGSP
ncbi:MAG: GntR family transcriptional regulator [Acidimicrobiia bacterium]|nr:GntR family transcriptional regulator [Acidimicrobiia bacterium]